MIHSPHTTSHFREQTEQITECTADVWVFLQARISSSGVLQTSFCPPTRRTIYKPNLGSNDFGTSCSWMIRPTTARTFIIWPDSGMKISESDSIHFSTTQAAALQSSAIMMMVF